MSSKRNDLLKIIAVCTMTIDHVGALFFPEQPAFRMVGRLAFPIFAYLVARGFERTRDKNRYLLRMGFFAIITIWPFYRFSMILSGDPYYQNVLFTFFFALVVLRFLEQQQYVLAIVMGVAPIVLLEGVGITMDYGWYGVGVVVLFYLLKESGPQMIALFGLTLGYQAIRMLPRGYPLSWVLGHVQLLSIFSVFLIHRPWKRTITLPKYAFYLFYPVHLMILVFIYNTIH